MMATQLFNWDEYLTLAKSLSTNADEASHRSAISRAYYFAFHAATIKAKLGGYTDRTHSRLWFFYQRQTDRNARRISTLGNQMQTAREEADYVASVADVSKLMESQLTTASQFAAVLALVPVGSVNP